MSRISVARLVTLAGYFALLLLLLNWFIWIAPPVQLPRALLIILLVVPLLLPLRGLLYGRRRTHQWTSFLSLFYFLMGVDVWYNNPPDERWLGALCTLFSLVLFAGSIHYAKYAGPPPVRRAGSSNDSAEPPTDSGSPG